ncbi:MAG: TlpA family protein disulfide reductase [Fusobacteriaceae bacterium]|jgi:thiol-disulfide isomerase/thioredoxin|nr:TlpA family protein disulfide reductase [Fusobacteriaceae bacterium]
MKKRTFLMIGALIVLVCNLIFNTGEKLYASSVKITKFPNFTTSDLDGKQVNQNIFKNNKLTMVNIWGTFCGPCLREMPELGELNKEYSKEGFAIVGIVIDTLNQDGSIDKGQVELAKKIVKETKADYLHLLPSDDLNEGKLKYVQYIPETVFVDENGNVVGESFIGSRSKKDWIEIIDKYLEEIK